MPSIQVRYPGRACVLGEHCDWAGGASLTVPLALGIEIRAEPTRTAVTLRSELEGEMFEGSWDPAEPRTEAGPLRFVPAAIRTLTQAGIPVVPADLWVQSDLPAGRGFSSSAAFSLGLLDALSRCAGHPQSTATLIDLAFHLEHDELGVDCGRLDPAACAAGQPLFLRWTKTASGTIDMGTRRVTPQSTLHFVVGAFDRPRDTQRILATLNKAHNGPVSDPDGDAVREAMAEFGSAAEAGAHAMETGDHSALGAAMNRAQEIYVHNLAGRFSSARAPRLIRVVAALRRLGASGAKFSGAGGDGSVLALFKTENEARSAAIVMEQRGIQAWYAGVGAP
jgi:mevalonate kinase